MSKTSEEELTEIFYKALRGKTVTTEQFAILGWAEERLKPAILKHFVPKEEVEAMKREARINELEKMLHSEVCEVMCGWSAKCDKQDLCPTIRRRIAQLTNNQSNTPKGEGE